MINIRRYRYIIAVLAIILAFAQIQLMRNHPLFSGYRYSSDQRKVIKEWGKPDSFFITFSSTDNGKSERFETWYYYDCGLSVSFTNGVYSDYDELEDLPREAIKVEYEPRQFEAYMRWQDVLDVIGDHPWIRASDLIPMFFEEETIELYYSKQIVVGFDTDSDSLMYVNTMILVPGEME